MRDNDRPQDSSSLPRASRKRYPNADRSPVPASLVALPPTPMLKLRKPLSMASRISMPVPLVVAFSGSYSSGRSNAMPDAVATSITAVRLSTAPKRASTGRPNGSSLFTLIHTPPVDSTMEAAVPSPPSATWSLSISQSGIAASMPSSIAAATCSDDKEPLNLSDAMTTFINTLFCRSCHSTYGMP